MVRVFLPPLLVLALLTGLTACQGDDKPAESGADRAASALAAALADGDLSGVSFGGGDAQAGYDAVVEGMDGLEPHVQVEQVSTDDAGTNARASLAWTWPVGE